MLLGSEIGARSTPSSRSASTCIGMNCATGPPR
jgi:hypothetical protein